MKADMIKLLCAGTLAFISAFGSCAAAELTRVGNWKVSFDEKNAELTLENATRHITLDGKVGFLNAGRAWTVALARDAAQNRLSLVDTKGTVYNYVSFRGEGDRLTFMVFHRAGADSFPGVFAYDAHFTMAGDTFACRTFAEMGEQVLNFGAGVDASPKYDAVFDVQRDLALRFASQMTRLTTQGEGRYGVHLEADVDNPVASSVTIMADADYFKSRWAPGYHPIDRKRCPKAPTGWMSWNTYFDKAGAAENLHEAKIGAKFLKPFGLEIWSIESWQDNSLWLPPREFHNLDLSRYEPQFPYSMKQLADEIRALGFRPGLWMPLYGTGDKKFYEAHKDWFVRDEKGKPIPCWCGDYMLDTTNEDALEHLRKITRIASREWGYEFFKFDGMANTPRKFERPEIRARMKHPNDVRWFDRSVEALRQGVGDDRVVLGCMGDFTGTEAQYLDASRLGSDVVGCYHGVAETYHPLGNSDFAQMPVKWENVVHQAKCTFAQIFINNIMFYTDPDTLLVGYTLEKHEAEVMAAIVGLPGQLMFSGDKLAQLRPERMKLIQQVLPVADIRPRNLYPYAQGSMLPVWNLAVTRPFDNWHIVALFNFDDGPKNFAVSFEDLGLDGSKTYAVHDFYAERFAGTFTGAISVENVPMRSVKIYAVRETTDRPQFVGDDRHITQGAVELTDLKWDASANVYTLGVKAIGGFPFTYFVRVPEGYAFDKATAEGSVKVTTKTAEGGVLAVTVATEKNCDARVALAFKR